MSTTHDTWGVPHQAAPDLMPAWEHTIDGLLAHCANTASRLGVVRERDPGFVPAICVEAFANLFKGRRALAARVRTLEAEAASALEKRPSQRDALLLQALGHWNRDEPTGALDCFEAMLAEHPLDPLVVKLQHGLLFMMGRSSDLLVALERVIDVWTPGTMARGYILGCHSFALEENARYEEAERVGRAAIEEQPNDAWGIHAVAHVMEACERQAEGLAWLNEHGAGYAKCSVFRRHVHWHRALLAIDCGDRDLALELYDAEVRDAWVGDYRDMSNCASLLWRLERAGVDVGDRWEPLAEIANEAATDHGSAFADAHYAMALARAGDPRILLDSLDAFAERQTTGAQADVVRTVGAPLCRAVVDAMCGRPTTLQSQVELAPLVQSIGGSHAQRDTFERMRIHAAIDAGNWSMAKTELEHRLARRPDNPWAKALLSRLLTEAHPGT